MNFYLLKKVHLYSYMANWVLCIYLEINTNYKYPLAGTGAPLWGTAIPLGGDRYPSWRTGIVLPIYAALLDYKYPLAGTGAPLWGTAIPLGGDWYPSWRTGTVLPIHAAFLDWIGWWITVSQSKSSGHCLYHWSVDTIMYVQLYYYLNPEAQSSREVERERDKTETGQRQAVVERASSGES